MGTSASRRSLAAGRCACGSTSPLPPLAASAVAIALACTSVAWGNPVGGVAVQGQASMVANGNALLVTTQNGPGLAHSAINWQSFSIPGGSSTYFQQPDAGSTVINRVVTSTPSLIFGTLGSNGNVVLVNQSGITVGAGGVVDTAGFTASALRMSDADALAGRLRFGDTSPSSAALAVQGSILARHGDVVLLGSSVQTGAPALIQAPNGSTVLAAGQQVDITARGLEGIVMRVQAPSDSVRNLGTLRGDAVALFAGSLHHSGDIAAHAVSVEGGRVVLKAQQSSQVDGRIQAQALNGHGGSVLVSAAQVDLGAGALVDVRGPQGGGEALLGGGLHGQDARLLNAQQTTVAAGAQVLADATQQGDGGTIAVWSDQATAVHATLSARGAGTFGNGGLVETSGHYLDVSGIAVSAAASGTGQAGTWLLDPYDIFIVNAPTNGPMPDTLPSPVAGQSSYGGGSNPSYLDAGTVATALANGTNVTVQTGGAGSAGTGLGDINVVAPISYRSSLHASLTLHAANNVNFDAGISATGGGGLDLVVTAGTPGDPTNFGSINLGSFQGAGPVGLYTGGGAVRMTASTGSISTGYAGSVISSSGGAVSLSAPNGSIAVDTISSNGLFSIGGNAGNGGSISLLAGTTVHVGTSLSADGGSVAATSGNGGNAGSVSVLIPNNCIDCTSGINSISAMGGSGGYGGGVSGSSGAVTMVLGQTFSTNTIAAESLSLNSLYGLDFSRASVALKSLQVTAGGGFSAITSGLGQFSARTTAPGSISLTNTGALTIASLAVTEGDILVDNTGALSTIGPIVATGTGIGGTGAISILAHSPLTVGAGGISGSGAINLSAMTASAQSSILLNGLVQSTGGAVSMTAFNSIAQNGYVGGAQGVTASASTGPISFGYNGYSGGAPLTYTDVNGAVLVPLVPASALAPPPFGTAVLQDVITATLDPTFYTNNPFAPGNRGRNGVVVEGQLCMP